MGKKRSDEQHKQQATPKAERKRRSEVVERIEDEARASFDLALERLEEKAARSFDKLMRQTRREAHAISGALQDLVKEAEASSRLAVDALADTHSTLTDRFEESLAAVEGHRLAMHELFAATDERSRESLARADAFVAALGEQVSEVTLRLDDVVRRHEENIGRVTAQATEQISVAGQAVAEQAERAQTEIARHVAELVACAERDAEELSEQARLRVDEEWDRVKEDMRGERGRIVERMRAELAQAATDVEELRARREMIQQLDDALLASASEAWQRVATVEQSVADVQRATARIGALSMRADASSEIMRTRLETIDQWFDGFVEQARHEGQRMVDVQAFDELVTAPRDAGQPMAEVEDQSVEESRTSPPMGEQDAQSDTEALFGRRASVGQTVEALAEGARAAQERAVEAEADLGDINVRFSQ